MIRDIVKMGDARLRRVAQPFDPADTAVPGTVADMLDTMRAAGGVGLAGPQIGIDLRIMVFGFDESARYPGEPPVRVTVLLNPTFARLSDEVADGWEGCLSIPGMRGLVPRAARIRYAGDLPGGGRLEREAHGFHARVFQHEHDHLDGILYLDRMTDLTQFGFIDVLFPDSPVAALERDGARER
ncbi:peptide deformylase [Sphingomonas sp. M6A6_1c]